MVQALSSLKETSDAHNEPSTTGYSPPQCKGLDLSSALILSIPSSVIYHQKLPPRELTEQKSSSVCRGRCRDQAVIVLLLSKKPLCACRYL